MNILGTSGKRWKHALVLAGLLAGITTTACGSGGACVHDFEGQFVRENTCYDQTDEETCTVSDFNTWHDGGSCQDLGFTEKCPGLFLNTHREDRYCRP